MAEECPESLTPTDLLSGVRPSGEVVVEGGGVVRGADLTNWRSSWLRFDEAASLLREILPRPLKPGRVGRDIPVFVDCDFSGLTCPAFDPGIARFVRCRFEDVDVALNLGTAHAHFTDCRFSGCWAGNFDARPSSADPARRVIVRGNDFTGCREFGVQGGVDRTANTFDPALHLVLWRGSADWSRVRRIAEEDTHLRDLVRSIEGRGPFDLGQDWVLLHRDLVGDDDLWTRLGEVTRS